MEDVLFSIVLFVLSLVIILIIKFIMYNIFKCKNFNKNKYISTLLLIIISFIVFVGLNYLIVKGNSYELSQNLSSYSMVYVLSLVISVIINLFIEFNIYRKKLYVYKENDKKDKIKNNNVIKNISNDYLVKCENQLYNCKPRGKFRKDKIIPLVGDKVEIDVKDNYILDIKKRKNSLIRPSVANVDKAIIVTSVKPRLDTNLLDKLLIITSYNNIDSVICFTKLDLLNDDELKNINNLIDYYKKIGYKC